MENFRFMKPYPLFKVEYEEIPKGNDKYSTFTVSVKIAQPMDWFKLYTTSSSAWAEISLKKLKEIFDLYVIHFIVENNTDTYYPMFEVNGEVYKTRYTFPEQSCICGEQIDGNQRYAEFSSDCEKFDYVKETVFFYERGTCLVKCNQLFLDGELLFDTDSFKALCESIGQDMCFLDTDPDKIIKYLRENYTESKLYECNSYTSVLN